MVDRMATRAYREAFASRVKRARLAAGYTQATMARLLGVSQPAVAKWEGGGRKACRDEVPALMPHYLMMNFCDICRVPIEWLLGGDNDNDVPPLRYRKARPPVAVPGHPDEA